jgi:hypothetical protein
MLGSSTVGVQLVASEEELSTVSEENDRERVSVNFRLSLSLSYSLAVMSVG